MKTLYFSSYSAGNQANLKDFMWSHTGVYIASIPNSAPVHEGQDPAQFGDFPALAQLLRQVNNLSKHLK